jgi:serine/threonine-protein kinase HipA
MARAAGVAMAETRLIATPRGGRYFATRRFDRTQQGRRHVHTVSGLLEASHKAPSIGYDDLLKLTLLLTRDARYVREMFRRMVFNVLAYNRDDHARNHAFMMDATGNWHPAPAYDLTFSLGTGGEHNLAVGGEGRNPGLPDILKVATKAGIARPDADGIFTEVHDVVLAWHRYADAAGLSVRRANEVMRVLAASRRT